ncbi:F-box protein SKIP23-like isoform X2 [Salvia miltiorrhiza]|uniref:F-box protein SKIP23-like isoform X2 n=1 Tax=Salvia miltiorrhiza TaxID=226208 RepID=UPI0025AD2E89|nr:F-box protein SKIP23-like isoform X2 [Salvia miltiorrhiza]
MLFPPHSPRILYAVNNTGSIMADWSKLPYDIVHKVATHLSVIEDFLAFSAVCCSWRSVYLAKEWNPGPQVPVLMFSNDDNINIRSFLSLNRNKVSNSELPEARGRRCWGSSSGWLVTIGYDHEIRLLNPFTHVSYNLPPKSSLEISFGDFLSWYDIIERAFVFRNPRTSDANEDLMVMIIYGTMKQLALCRPGYSSWRCVKDKIHAEFIDVTCVKDQIFALSFMGVLVLIDIDSLAVTAISGQDPPRNVALSLITGGSEQISLVESSGDLWMVYQAQGRNPWRSRVESTAFLVYNFDFDNKQWIRLSNLGSRTIFVGDSSSIVVRATCSLKCESNSVYFVASRKENGWPKRMTHVNVGVYSVRSGVSVHLCIGPDIPKRFSFPMWVLPTLY